MNINEVTLNSIDRHFNYLSNFGIAPKSLQETILVLLLIQTILYSSMGELVTEEDYKILNKVLSCLNIKSCLIEYSELGETSILQDTQLLGYFKLTELELDLRLMEDNSLKLQSL